MQMIKNRQIIDNTWRYAADGEEVPAGDVTVSMPRWQKERQHLLDGDGNIGLRLQPADEVDDIAGDLHRFPVIELNFPALADGRVFSQAWLLRNRYGYQGEIRATGHFLPDQVFYLSRVGVDAFLPEKQENLPLLLSCLNDFSVKYQKSTR